MEPEVYGDPRKCPIHGTPISSPDGMFDAPCGACEFDADEEEKAAFHGLPPGWENAPISAQIAFLVAGDDPDAFDEIKATLKGEIPF